MAFQFLNRQLLDRPAYLDNNKNNNKSVTSPKTDQSPRVTNGSIAVAKPLVTVLLLGDAGVGKTSLVEAYFREEDPDGDKTPDMSGEAASPASSKTVRIDETSDAKPAEDKTKSMVQKDLDIRQQIHKPHLFFSMRHLVDGNGAAYTLGIWDAQTTMSSVDDMVPLPVLESSMTVPMLCFSLDSDRSFKRVRERWMSPAMRAMLEQKKLVFLVGTKADSHHRTVKKSEAYALAEEFKNMFYVETSATTGYHVKQLFKATTEHVLNGKRLTFAF